MIILFLSSSMLRNLLDIERNKINENNGSGIK